MHSNSAAYNSNSADITTGGNGTLGGGKEGGGEGSTGGSSEEWEQCNELKV